MYKSKVSNLLAKGGALSVTFNSYGGPQRIVSKIQDEDIRKAIADDLAHILLDKVNEYVPESSGMLKRKGYKIHLATTPARATARLSYNNTRKVPYVLYQYFGVVYGPNYATFEQEKVSETSIKKDMRLRKAVINQTGWVSPRGKGSKHPTKNLIGESRPPIHLKNGLTIEITGYTKNKNAHDAWLEYVRDTSTIWYPLRQDMIDYVEQFYSQFVGEDDTSKLWPNKAIEIWHKRHDVIKEKKVWW